jgi:anti-sigma B factor antagonist
MRYGRKRWMSSPSFDPRQYVTVSVTLSHDVVVVAVSGEIDMATRDVVSQALHAHLDATPSGMVIDLSEVEFLGSVGLRVLIEVNDRALRCHTRLGIVMSGNPAVTRTMQISGLVKLLRTYPTVTDAVTSMTAHMSGGVVSRSFR